MPSLLVAKGEEFFHHIRQGSVRSADAEGVVELMVKHEEALIHSTIRGTGGVGAGGWCDHPGDGSVIICIPPHRRSGDDGGHDGGAEGAGLVAA